MSEEAGLAALRRRALVATTIGNALEWFDFVVFGLFAGVIGKLFFTTDGAANALLLAFATFGVAFVARPLGGVLFGLFADRVGRKTALVWMIGLMAVGTGMIAVLPTYAAIGIAAPMLLVLARLIQGFSAGGEFGGASALLLEVRDDNAAARALYARTGFEHVSRRRGYYQPEGVDALVLRRLLSPVDGGAQ